MSYIIANNLVKTYGNGDATVTAISGVNFGIDAGEFVGIMGESGAGKSTLLSILGAMNKPTEGTLIVDDIDIYSLGQEQRADFRREFLGFVFQSFHFVKTPAYFRRHQSMSDPSSSMQSLEGRCELWNQERFRL